jgi:hypothetical protein
MTIHFKELVITLKQKNNKMQTNFEFCNMHL